jgi:hypothetical protein
VEGGQGVFNRFVLRPEAAVQNADVGRRTFPVLGERFVEGR